MNRIKKFFQTAESKNGSYSVGITVLVLVIVVIVNLIVGQLPENVRNIDVSSNQIYEISDTTKELLSTLDQDVKMTVLAEKEDTDERIRTFLSKYSALSGHISVEWIDPVLHPSALTQYNASANTIVVSCEATGKTTNILFDDIIVVDAYSYYYTGTASESEFDGDGQLTSAVNYVTTNTTRTIYRTSGHGESTFSTTISDLMDKSNYTVTELNMVMNPTVPEDCDLLFMYAPTTDLSEEEMNAVEQYLKDGGKVMILLGDTNKGDLPNLEGLMADYGLEMADGYIADLSRCYQGNYYYLFPQLSLQADLASGISTEMVLAVNTHGLTETEPARDTIALSSFMTTSQDGYAVTEESEEQGTYILGAVATETIEEAGNETAENETAESEDAESEDVENEDVENEDAAAETGEADGEESSAAADETETKESRLTVIASASMIDAQVTDSFSTLENTTLFMNAVTANFDGEVNISIEPKSLAAEYNTVRYGGWFSILLIFGVPLVILISGFVIWWKRRKS